MTIKVGGGGFPEARATYFPEFSLVEVQQTFYQPPQAKTVRLWRDSRLRDIFPLSFQERAGVR